ncbi:MAG: hypothetical protein ABSB32_18045 [Thermodesulfobacteriota bacterium]|jgi:hypothetical protein
MPNLFESKEENYKREFIGSLYTEASQNTGSSWQGQPEIYQFIITTVGSVVPERSGQLKISKSSVGRIGSGMLTGLDVVNSHIFDFDYESSSVTFYCAKVCDRFDKGLSEDNQVATYVSSIGHLILSEPSAHVPKDDPTESARKIISQLSNRNIAVEALKIFERLQQLLTDSHIKNLPPIRSFVLEDGSVLVELISAHSRLGFSIEQDRHESSWYLVTDETQRNIRASGDIGNDDIELPVNWALMLLG